MTRHSRPLSLLLAATLTLPSIAQPQKHAMVVTLSHDASDAGLAILKQGGNAVDAAVAVAFSLAVVAPNVGNLGGGGFMLYRDAKTGAAHFLDFRERAPAAATPTMYQDAQGNIIPGLSTLGYKAIGVPGSVAGLVYAQQHFGKLTLAQDMAPAIKFATEGCILSAEQARVLHAKNLTQFPESARIFQRNGNFYAEGDLFKQPELARTLIEISKNPASFYHGDLAKKLAADMQTHGGLITEADLAAYQVVDRKPLLGQFKTHGATYDIVTSPPPSSGGIVLLETLNMLSGFDLPAAGADRSPAQIHYITEAFRRAYMDRADYLGDPDYNSIPLTQMASPKYAAAWAASIDPTKPTPSADLKRPSDFLPPPPASKPQPKESTQTTHFSIIDEHGNAISMTYTLNGYFGSGATATGLGFLLNNEMDDFSSKPGSPNMFGLIQGPANAVAPGHRPLSSMTPTIVTTHATPGHPAKPVLILGSPGGSTIITTVANDLISILVNGMPVQQAADAPRFHHQYLPDVLDFEKDFPLETVQALEKMGYKVRQTQAADTTSAGVWGDSELISIDPLTGALAGGNDHRHTFGSIASY
jgi:gamma-glutamyltranspeptidase/glutathione hydrolase